MPWLAALAVAGLWGVPSAASAAPELRLDWQAPAACPDGEWAHARVAQRLGRALHDDVTPGLGATVQIVEQGGSFTLRLNTRVGEERGRRGRKNSAEHGAARVERAGGRRDFDPRTSRPSRSGGI